MLRPTSWDLLQLNRVTKVLKGGKLMKFRACVVSGNHEGEVGYGVASAREVVEAVNRASAIAKSTAITVPMSKGRTFPHKIQIKEGAARIMLRPASEGTGVIAGGSVRVVLEMAGYQNAFGKIYGTSSAMNNTRGTIAALSQMFTWRGVAKSRGCTIDYAMGRVPEPNQIVGKQSRSPQPVVARREAVDPPTQDTLE
jgi:small subunit ribosomal protein S5